MVRTRHIAMAVFTIALIAVVSAGCSAFMAVNERAISAEDVIRMTKAGIGNDVIIRQIEVTRSRFVLTPTDLIRLKESGVSDKVLEVMVETENYPAYYGDEYGYGYDPYDYGFNYYNSWYPVATHYPYVYNVMYPYTTYRRTDLIGRFYREAPVVSPPYRIYNRSNEWFYPQRRDSRENEDDDK